MLSDSTHFTMEYKYPVFNSAEYSYLSVVASTIRSLGPFRGRGTAFRSRRRPLLVSSISGGCRLAWPQLPKATNHSSSLSALGSEKSYQRPLNTTRGETHPCTKHSPSQWLCRGPLPVGLPIGRIKLQAQHDIQHVHD